MIAKYDVLFDEKVDKAASQINRDHILKMSQCREIARSVLLVAMEVEAKELLNEVPNT